jgi:chaperone protein EcpD
MKTSLRMLLGSFVVGALVLMSCGAHAGVIILSTRVILNAEAHEATVKLSNQGEKPALVQLWIDNGNETASPDTLAVPFDLEPPMARIEPGKQQVVRVVYAGNPLPTDRESVFWLNVLEVPPKVTPKDGENLVQFAFRTRIKLFYRPSGLKGTPHDAMAGLKWAVVSKGKGYAVKVTNDAPYYVSFSDIRVTSGGTTYSSDSGGMVAPQGSSTFSFSKLTSAPSASAKIQADAIDDYGGTQEVNSTLQPN